jgi:nucleotide-binding universal stress UspA family protein
MLRAVIALDGSPGAQQALTLAGELLSGKQTAVTLLHVIPRHPAHGSGGSLPGERDDLVEQQARAKSLLARAGAQLRARGVGPLVTEDVALGDPADLILKEAAAVGADLIVVGSRGLNAAERFLLGSVSTTVATHARCPVLVVHSQTAVPDAVAGGDPAEMCTVC